MDSNDFAPGRTVVLSVALLMLWAYWGPISSFVDRVAGTGIAGDYLALLTLVAMVVVAVALHRRSRTTPCAVAVAPPEQELADPPAAMPPPPAAPEGAATVAPAPIDPFEPTFFRLLALHREIVATARKGDIVGMPAFNRHIDGLKTSLKETSFQDAWTIYEPHLGHYLRTLDTILLFVAERSPDPEFHFRILRGMLCENERYVIVRAAEFGEEAFRNRVIQSGIVTSTD